MTTPPVQPRLSRRYLLLVILLAIGLYILVPQVGEFRSSGHLLRHLRLPWVLLAVGLTGLTYLAGAATYCFLAFRRLRYGRTALVQLAAMLINRLLPVGIGGIGANFAYLRHERHTTVQAASMVGVNNLLGALGHGLLVAGALLVFSGRMSVTPSYGGTVSSLIKLATVLILAVVVGVLIFGKQKLARQLNDLKRQLLSYRQRPLRLPAALLSSMVLTLCNVLCLGACALAVGVHLPFVVMLLVFTFGIGAGTATPTPGGLGGFEAGLAAGFVAYHVAGPTALAAALLYRLVSYWLPLLFGAPAFIICQRRKLFSI